MTSVVDACSAAVGSRESLASHVDDFLAHGSRRGTGISRRREIGIDSQGGIRISIRRRIGHVALVNSRLFVSSLMTVAGICGGLGHLGIVLLASGIKLYFQAPRERSKGARMCR